jgi:hypothetical protein
MDGADSRPPNHEILGALFHDSEINATGSWLDDGVWLVRLGDICNGIETEAVVESLGGAIALRSNAVRLHPDSAFACKCARDFE